MPRVSMRCAAVVVLALMLTLAGGCYTVVYPNQGGTTPTPTPTPTATTPGVPSPGPSASPSSYGSGGAAGRG